MTKSWYAETSLDIYLLIGSLMLILITAGVTQPLKAQSSVPQSPTSPQRRTRVIKPRRVPIQVWAVRSLNDPNWLDNLEIEIRNLSEKPVYYINVSLHFPDLPKSSDLDGIDRDLAIVMSYGRNELMQAEKLADANDVPIHPGRTQILKIHDAYKRGLLRFLSKNGLSLDVIKTIEISIGSLSFGDGTGYVGGAPVSLKRTSKVNIPFIKDERSSVMKVGAFISTPFPSSGSGVFFLKTRPTSSINFRPTPL